MDLEAQWISAANTAVAMITTYGLRVLGAIVILLAGWMASRLVYSAVVRLCEKSPRIDRTVALFLGNGARYTALVFTFVAVLTTFGIATTSFVAVLGALGIAIGLALQGHAQQPRRGQSCWSCSARFESATASRPAASPARPARSTSSSPRSQRRQRAHHHPNGQAVGRDRARADPQRHRAARAAFSSDRPMTMSAAPSPACAS